MADQPQATRSSRVIVTYKLRFSDLYWMWETSAAGLIGTAAFVSLGLMFIAVVLEPADNPVAADVGVGILFLLLAPILVPFLMLFASGKFQMIGRSVRITFDDRGVDGWPVAAFRTTDWDDLRHPRLESRVLVLPFSWPFADAWAVVPARAFSPEQFGRLLTILHGKGVFLDGDRRSPMGRLLALLANHMPLRRGDSEPGHLVAFPRLPRAPRAKGASIGK